VGTSEPATFDCPSASGEKHFVAASIAVEQSNEITLFKKLFEKTHVMSREKYISQEIAIYY